MAAAVAIQPSNSRVDIWTLLNIYVKECIRAKIILFSASVRQQKMNVY